MFEDEERKEKLSNLGNPLEALDELIDFEMFRPVLEESLSNKSGRVTPDGHRRADHRGDAEPSPGAIRGPLPLLRRTLHREPRGKGA